MAATAADLQSAIFFATKNEVSPRDMVRLIDAAVASQFVASGGSSQMITLSAGADGVTATYAYEVVIKLRKYYSDISNGGIFVQKAEFPQIQRVPGQSP